MISRNVWRTCAIKSMRRCTTQFPVTGPVLGRHLHEYLVMVNDSRDVRNLNLKQTFAGKVMSEEASNPQTIFACQAHSIEDLEKELFKNEVPDRAAVRIFPLETVHTSTLELEEESRDSQPPRKSAAETEKLLRH